ncbi:MAG: signal recognition particle protein [Casimicrobiaceae bacterium]|nr:signal recognition particle protein [Casimicrobiaceae bacterium]MCX8098494.1 signal recognition particle protein [Casimicrobiaceae bacterium]MDW8311597.1 signal recognition particle protein [Burkholderiales bacterium]
MPSQLTERLARFVKAVRGQARLTDANIQEALREVRLALIEADVAVPVVKRFIERVREAALGAEVATSLTPGQAFIAIVHRELVALMRPPEGQSAELNVAVRPPAVILLVGLQGSGKTTTAAKLALHLRTRKKKKVLLVPCDTHRPAARDQLRMLAQSVGVDHYEPDESESSDPVAIARAALAWARPRYYDVLIVDTAGRLAIDEAMMQEVRAVSEAVEPHETLYVVDAMQGQDALATARAFHERLRLTGIVLTKTDGDARGGVALSVREVTGVAIKLIGVSEKPDGLEPFRPEQMADRILGMGDIVALVESTVKAVDVEKAKALAEKVKRGKSFDLEDFREQLAQMKKLGGVESLLDKLPHELQQAAARSGGVDLRQIARMEGIICSMTPAERRRPELIKASRKRRIAAGAGVSVQEVNRLLAQFEQTQAMMKKFSQGGMGKLLRGLGPLPGLSGLKTGAPGWAKRK